MAARTTGSNRAIGSVGWLCWKFVEITTLNTKHQHLVVALAIVFNLFRTRKVHSSNHETAYHTSSEICRLISRTSFHINRQCNTIPIFSNGTKQQSPTLPSGLLAHVKHLLWATYIFAGSTPRFRTVLRDLNVFENVKHMIVYLLNQADALRNQLFPGSSTLRAKTTS